MATRLYPDAKQIDSMEDGLKFQAFVKTKLAGIGITVDYYEMREDQFSIGESEQGIEVKLDSRCTDTGRLSIEVAEKSRRSIGVWTPSGIYRKDNSTLYVQGNYKVFFVFKKSKLIELHGRYVDTEIYKLGTIKTFYLPIYHAYNAADIIMHGKYGQMDFVPIESPCPPGYISLWPDDGPMPIRIMHTVR